MKEKRCHCGQLLAVWLEGCLEIKCRRCKRFEKVSLEDLRDFVTQKIKDRGLLSPEPSLEKKGVQ
ncbi:MAG: hypothetical protein A2901_00255 [Elusimicrobia bacterium RIFCSPLOWO2_01_FULL_54_10]|nr:MAG: hypothetical protein A2901_00255 [Elusimicrobia bacterium RIFCSPLOWO2_01_FULL_54_10]